eukprot:4101300-Pyramimonas_sp.AAC.1
MPLWIDKTALFNYSTHNSSLDCLSTSFLPRAISDKARRSSVPTRAVHVKGCDDTTHRVSDVFRMGGHRSAGRLHVDTSRP